MAVHCVRTQEAVLRNGEGRWNTPLGELQTDRGCGRDVCNREYSEAFTRIAGLFTRWSAKGQRFTRADDDEVTGTPSGYMMDPPLMHWSVTVAR